MGTLKQPKKISNENLVNKDRYLRFIWLRRIILILVIGWLVGLGIILFRPNPSLSSNGFSVTQLLSFVLTGGLIFIGNCYCWLNQWYYYYLNVKHQEFDFDQVSVYNAKYGRFISVALLIYIGYNIIEAGSVITFGFIPQALAFGGIPPEAFIIISLTLIIYIISLISASLCFYQTNKYFKRFLNT